MRNKLITLPLIISLLVSLSPTSVAEGKKQVQASDIGWDVEIVGKLGSPLWSLLEVEGTVIEEKKQHAKDHDKHIVIIHSIGETVLDSPIRIILLDSNIPPLNTKMKMRVVETGRLTYFTTPSLSISDDPRKHSRQRIFTGLKIDEIITKS